MAIVLLCNVHYLAIALWNWWFGLIYALKLGIMTKSEFMFGIIPVGLIAFCEIDQTVNIYIFVELPQAPHVILCAVYNTVLLPFALPLYIQSISTLRVNFLLPPRARPIFASRQLFNNFSPRHVPSGQP